MTIPSERYRAIVRAGQVLIKAITLTDVPPKLAQDARSALRHVPTTYDLQLLATASPEILEVPDDSR